MSFVGMLAQITYLPCLISGFIFTGGTELQVRDPRDVVLSFTKTPVGDWYVHICILFFVQENKEIRPLTSDITPSLSLHLLTAAMFTL